MQHTHTSVHTTHMTHMYTHDTHSHTHMTPMTHLYMSTYMIHIYISTHQPFLIRVRATFGEGITLCKE